MNELTRWIKLRIVFKVDDQILKKTYHVLVCQKCGHRAKIRDTNNIPKTCSKCKCSPYTGPGKKGRPRK